MSIAKPFFRFFFIATAAILMTLSACSKEIEEPFVGKWKGINKTNALKVVISIEKNGDSFLIRMQRDHRNRYKVVQPASLASGVLTMNAFQTFSIDKTTGKLIGDTEIPDGFSKITDDEYKIEINSPEPDSKQIYLTK